LGTFSRKPEESLRRREKIVIAALSDSEKEKERGGERLTGS